MQSGFIKFASGELASESLTWRTSKLGPRSISCQLILFKRRKPKRQTKPLNNVSPLC